MNKLNPELESQINALGDLCCSALDRQEVEVDASAEPLLQALATGGYARLSDANLQTRLESCAVEKCQELAIHRRGELTGITGRMQSKFDELVLWKTQTPRPPSGTKAANFSANTDT